MNKGTAMTIFKNLFDSRYSIAEKRAAIRTVIDMETHNSITKCQMLVCMNWMWNQIFELEQSEPCNDDKGCSNCMYSGRPTYKSPCSECRDRSQWEMKPISRSHENGTECEDTISRQAAIDVVCAVCGNDCDKSKFVYDALQDDQIIMCPEHYGLTQLPSAQSKKFSEVLQDMMDEDYYLFCHTGYSRLAEKDWEWLIEQVKEMEQKGRTDGNSRD